MEKQSPQGKSSASGLSRLGALLLGAGVLVSLLAVAAVMGELREAAHLLGGLRWQALILVVPVAMTNHGVRYWRWKILLEQVASRDLKAGTVALIFGAGSLLIFTPARAGEFAKSVYARQYLGVPMASSLPILLAERLGDVAVMAILGSLGLLLLGEAPGYWLAALILGGGLLLFTVVVPLLEGGARRGKKRLQSGSRLGNMLSLADQSGRVLLQRNTVRVNLGLGILAWTLEVLVFFLSLAAVGVPVELHLFVLALAVYPLGALGGALSLLPAGLGAAEGGLIALGVLVGGLSGDVALAAALLSRVAVLGVVVLAGLASMGLLHRVPHFADVGDPAPS
jgi:uncharacterized protein (TIRG00374 family)